MITEQSAPLKHFSFKSKTNEGFAGHINVIYYKNAVEITKTFISKRNITSLHIRLIKPFKKFSIYQEKITVKDHTLFTIANQILKYKYEQL